MQDQLAWAKSLNPNPFKARVRMTTDEAQLLAKRREDAAKGIIRVGSM